MAVMNTPFRFMKNKKGLFFTFISIIIAFSLLVLFTKSKSVLVEDDTTVVKGRILFVNDYVVTLKEQYFPESVRVTTYRALHAITYYMNETPFFFVNYTDFNRNFTEVFLYGRISGQPIDDLTHRSIMANRSFYDRFYQLQELSEKNLKFRSGMKVHNVTLYQSNSTTPWAVGVRVNLTFWIIDEFASYNATEIVDTMLDIE
ncbi:hypothetical protein COY95_00790, partial [Candidatus Woesearchaeota archaeon CG_4_10_14_0_8_um_filter_47_5]